MDMRKKLARVGIILLTLMAFSGFTIIQVDAASRKKPTKTVAPSKKPAAIKSKKSLQRHNVKVNSAVKNIPKSCDLAIVEVATINCVCRDCLFGEGYLFPMEVKVLVANWGPTTTHGKVTLKYRDINNSLKSRTMPTGMLAKNQTRWLSFFGPVVAKKNACFKALIVESTSTMPDTNLSNNRGKNCTCTPLVK